jgi:hypothetical protein
VPVLILLVIFGSVFATVFGISLLRHRQKMAELEVRKIEALAALKSRALPASSDDASARALLDAYVEADRTLAKYGD